MAEKSGWQKFEILDGKVHVFRRPASSFWWAGFHFRGKYLRTSTKQVRRTAAEVVAREWFFKKQGEIASGMLVSGGPKFSKVASDALKRYLQRVERGERSIATYEGIRGNLDARLTPFFGNTPIDHIGVQQWFEFKEAILARSPHIKRGTMHQYKNALRVVLNDAYRQGLIKQLPVFKDEYSARRIESPRPWFTPPEYRKLLSAVRRHRKFLEVTQPRWLAAADELYDYIIWGTNTGCRVSEIANTRFCDVEIRTEKSTGLEFALIRNIKGKRGGGVCRSFYGAVAAFRRRVAARRITDPAQSTDKLFLEHHREMFKEILTKEDLRYSNTQPPAKRDFVSLRATYICFRLLNGASVYEIANNCRTSVAMIESSYARHLSGEILEGVNKIKGMVEGWDATD
jgi:hypothetical protein